MDKETLSQYGWIVICIIIIALMLGLATPFGKYIGDATFKAMDSFKSKTETVLGIESSSGEVEEPAKPEDTYPETPPELLSSMIFVLNSNQTSYTLGRETLSEGTKTLTNESFSDIIIPSEYNGLPVTFIASKAFSFNSNIKSVIIPSSVTEVSSYVFSDCTNLKEVKIYDGLIRIGRYMFNNCTNLETVNLPKTITHIDSGGFCNCTSLKNINYAGTKEDWNSFISSISYWGYHAHPIVHCTDGDITY